MEIKSNWDNEKRFRCRLKVKSIHDGMREQDIYEIESLRIANREEVKKEVLQRTYVCT